MFPTALMDTATFKKAVGISEAQFANAALFGILPRAVGALNGAPLWNETDVRAFALANGYTFNGESPDGTNAVVVQPTANSDTVTITNGTGEPVRVHFRDAAAVAFPDPATEVGATTHGPAPTDKSGTVRITRAFIPPRTLAALAKVDLSAPDRYAVGQLPPLVLAELPKGLLRPVPDESKRRTTYSTAELAAYLGCSQSVVSRWAQLLKMRPKHVTRNGVQITEYTHSQATTIRNSRPYKASSMRSLEARKRMHAALIAYLTDGTHTDDDKGQGLAPHRTPVAEAGTAREAIGTSGDGVERIVQSPKVEVIPPEVWLTEAAAADHLGWPLDVLRIARKERTGPLATFRTNQIMYRVTDLDLWKAANTTRHDEMKRMCDVELDEHAAAEFVGLTVTTLGNLRNKKYNPRARNALQSPAFHRVGRHGTPMYWRNDLSAWMVHNAAAIAKRKAIIADPAVQRAVAKAREKLAANRAALAKATGSQKIDTSPAGQSDTSGGDKVAQALVAQAHARKPVSQALNRSLTNGRATFADKIEAHNNGAGKVGKKSVVKATRNLAGNPLHH